MCPEFVEYCWICSQVSFLSLDDQIIHIVLNNNPKHSSIAPALLGGK